MDTTFSIKMVDLILGGFILFVVTEFAREGKNNSRRIFHISERRFWIHDLVYYLLWIYFLAFILILILSPKSIFYFILSFFEYSWFTALFTVIFANVLALLLIAAIYNTNDLTKEYNKKLDKQKKIE